LENANFEFYSAYSVDGGLSEIDNKDEPWNTLFDPATVTYSEIEDEVAVSDLVEDNPYE
jgi:hypothetical protein